MSSSIIPACVETINIPEISAQDIEEFSLYKATYPCHTGTFDHKYCNKSEAIYFRKRPEGRESDEIYYTSSTDDPTATQVTYLTGNGKGNVINAFIPIDYDEDISGQRREGGAICTIDSNGEEFFQICRLLPGSDKEWQKLEAWTAPGVLVRSMKISNDGSKLFYVSNARNGKDMDLYIRHLKHRPSNEPEHGKLVLEMDGVWSLAETNVDDSKLVAAHSISSSLVELWLYDIKTGEMDQVVLPGNNDDSAGIRIIGWFSKTDPSLLYLSTNWMSEYNSIVVYHIGTKSARPITTPTLKESLLPIPWACLCQLTKTKMLIQAKVDGYDELYVMDIATDVIKKVDIPESMAGQVTSLKTSTLDPNLAIFSLDSVASPGVMYQINLETLQLKPYKCTEISQAPHPSGFPKLIRYKSFDGLDIPAFVYLPSKYNGVSIDTISADDKLPVIVYMHGGPSSQHTPSYNPRLYLQYFVHSLNCCVIAPNIRGSSGYGKTYMEADDGVKREDSVKDIGSLLDYISTDLPFLDSSRIAAMGRSYGGYMTLACMTHYSGRLKCAVETCGISNWVTFLENTASHRRNNRRGEYGDERDPVMREFLHKISPINNVDKITIPAFMSHGRNDTRVPFSEFEQMKDILQKNNGADSVWAFMADNEGHIYRQKSVADAQVVCMVKFLKHFL
ncbi:Alpha/Beta hydrolase protein [Umbelopsis sp. PMI_123]|nr:Alpha/Beta hydrolase protein [Umbelopsis sp. PMI_123]